MGCIKPPLGDAIGPFGIDYIALYFCELGGQPFLATFVLLLWQFYLVNILGSTAANYFSPTLSSICTLLKLPYNIAGITLLAFGNGAPDVFSTMASFTGSGDNSDVGIGALLGGSMFVANVVVGSIAILCPCEVSRPLFFRDIIFHLFAVTCVASIALTGGTVTLLTACLLFVLYFTYVAIVLVYSLRNPTQPDLDEFLANKNKVLSNIQTAFWHAPTSGTHAAATSSMSGGAMYQGLSALYTSSAFSQRSTLSSMEEFELRNTNFNPNSYTFLTLDDEDSASALGGDEEDSEENGGNGFHGAFSSAFQATIIEDYFTIDSPYLKNTNSVSDAAPQANIIHSKNSKKYPQRNTTALPHSTEPKNIPPRMSLQNSNLGEDDDSNLSDDHQQLTQRLLVPFDVDDGNLEPRAASGAPTVALKRIARNKPRGYMSTLMAFYYHQKVFNKSIRRRLLSSEFWEYPISQKLWVLLELPAVLARDLTIPNCDAPTWNKYYAVAQPLFAVLFALFTSGEIVGTGGEHAPNWLFGLLAALPVSFLVYVFTYRNKPPSGLVFSNLWNAAGFVMCILWIYALAKELVTCLTAMGLIFNISPSFLGLTVLAWGNSIGDFFSNISIARQGLGEMAIAGCYGGPVFNILVGLGLPFIYICTKHYPQPLHIELDTFAIVSLCFIYFSLISTMVIVYFRDCQMDRPFGIYLLSLYALYTVCQMILVLV